MKNLYKSKLLFWTLLSLPAIPLAIDLVEEQRYYGEIMYRSGIWSCGFLVVGLMVTPLRTLLTNISEYRQAQARQAIFVMIRNRRYLGVAAMGYAMLHTAFYLRKLGDLETVVSDVTRFEIVTGWIALVVLLLLGLTSNDYSVQKMARRWKSLHKWVYVGAIAVFVHWFLFDYRYREIYYWFVPLLSLQLYRLYWWRHKSKVR